MDAGRLIISSDRQRKAPPERGLSFQEPLGGGVLPAFWRVPG
jgi:hypothetical protein